MAISTRNEGSKVNANINVTPMVDVMLVLLIIFMVITPMLQKGVSVDLAKVNNPALLPRQSPALSVMAKSMKPSKLRNATRRAIWRRWSQQA